MILNDIQITELANKGMISPFIDGQVRLAERGKMISYGVSSFGYDLRVKDGFKLFKQNKLHNSYIDPKAIEQTATFENLHANGTDFIMIPPHSFALAESVEYFKMPDNVLGVVYGKSTYARCGIITNVTPLEPGWEGTVTLEISNTTPLPAKIYINEGLCQVLFMAGDRPKTTYRDRAGKYQKQSGITLPKV